MQINYIKGYVSTSFIMNETLSHIEDIACMNFNTVVYIDLFYGCLYIQTLFFVANAQ